MKRTILAAGTALTLALTAVAPAAFAQDAMDTTEMRSGNDMLRASLENGLTQRGLPTDNIDNLSLSEIAQIITLLEESGMGSNDRIELILNEAAE